jgi:hypothetical protein
MYRLARVAVMRCDVACSCVGRCRGVYSDPRSLYTLAHEWSDVAMTEDTIRRSMTEAGAGSARVTAIVAFSAACSAAMDCSQIRPLAIVGLGDSPQRRAQQLGQDITRSVRRPIWNRMQM